MGAYLIICAYSYKKGGDKVKILGALIGVVVVIIVLANAIPVLWPIATGASANITAMTGTDAGTETIQAFWPIVLLLVGLGIAISLIVYALRRFGVLGGGSIG